VLPDASLLWRACVRGTHNVPAAIEKIGQQTANEYFAININTKEIVARVNCKPESTQAGFPADRDLTARNEGLDDGRGTRETRG